MLSPQSCPTLCDPTGCSPPTRLNPPGTEPTSPVFHALAGRFFTAEPPGKTTFILSAAIIAIIIIILTFQVKLGHREVNELAQDPLASGGRVWPQGPLFSSAFLSFMVWEFSEKNYYHNEYQIKDNKSKSHLIDLSIAFFFFRNIQEMCLFQLGITNDTIISPPNFTPQLVPGYL